MKDVGDPDRGKGSGRLQAGECRRIVYNFGRQQYFLAASGLHIPGRGIVHPAGEGNTRKQPSVGTIPKSMDRSGRRRFDFYSWQRAYGASSGRSAVRGRTTRPGRHRNLSGRARYRADQDQHRGKHRAWAGGRHLPIVTVGRELSRVTSGSVLVPFGRQKRQSPRFTKAEA